MVASGDSSCLRSCVYSVVLVSEALHSVSVPTLAVDSAATVSSAVSVSCTVLRWASVNVGSVVLTVCLSVRSSVRSALGSAAVLSSVMLAEMAIAVDAVRSVSGGLTSEETSHCGTVAGASACVRGRYRSLVRSRLVSPPGAAYVG